MKTKNAVMAFVAMLCLCSCEPETPTPTTPAPAGPGGPSVPVLAGDWLYDKYETRSYGYPPFYPHDTLLTVHVVQTYSDSSCHLELQTAAYPFEAGWMNAYNGMSCSDLQQKWRQVNTDGKSCINLGGAFYYPDTVTSTKLVLRYPHQDGQSSYTYHYFHK